MNIFSICIYTCPLNIQSDLSIAQTKLGLKSRTFSKINKLPTFSEINLARVLPLHKSGSKTCIDNYRPVSILCVLSKVLEKHIYKHFYRFLTKYDMLSEYQSGF